MSLELVLDQNILGVMDRGRAAWSAHLPDVAIVGELTVEEWPGGDDYFLVLVDIARKWIAISMDAPGVTPVLEQMKTILSDRLEPILIASTSFNSAVLWPPALRGQQLLERRLRRTKNLIGSCFGCRYECLVLSTPMRRYLRDTRRPA